MKQVLARYLTEYGRWQAGYAEYPLLHRSVDRDCVHISVYLVNPYGAK